MLSEVKDYGLKFKGQLARRTNTNLIVLHHTQGGTAETVGSIHALHLAKGNKGIDYNICVEKNGTVVWGRGLDAIGGHTNNSYSKTRGVNARSVGIVALGDMDRNPMSKAQLDAIKEVTRAVVKYYGIKEVLSHKEIAGSNYTDCPGKYFPTEEIRAYALGNDNLIPDEKNPLLWRVAVGVLNFREGASTKSKVLKILQKGDVVRLDRYVAGEDWARVYVDGVLGYVWLKYIEEDK